MRSVPLEEARRRTIARGVVVGLASLVAAVLLVRPSGGRLNGAGIVVACTASAAVVLAGWVATRLAGRSWTASEPEAEDVIAPLRLAQLLTQADVEHLSLIGPGGEILHDRPDAAGPGAQMARTTGDLLRRVHPADRQGVADWLKEIRAVAGRSGTHVYREQRPEGAYVTIESSALNMLDAPGIRAVVVATRDPAEDRLADGAPAVMLHDGLTGLASRSRLIEEMEVTGRRALLAGRQAAVLFCDLDRFKVVNDSLGREFGDELLRVVSERLSDAVRPGDMVGRLASDEFVILAGDLQVADEAEGLAQRVLSVLAEPVNLFDTGIVTSASIGIAFLGDGADPESVLRDAGIAMAQAKAGGGGTARVFSDHLRERVEKRLDTERELRRALAQSELRLVYQPIVSLTEGLVAAEALVRWQHPERGLIGPAEFLPVAEETGLIVNVGDWVLAEACRTAVELGRVMGDDAPTLTVNLSMRQLIEPSFVSRVQLHLAQAGLDPARLILEVTEDSLVNELERCIPVLSELASLGLGIAIDDFGTGLSSLSYVKRLPMARTLKIDRSFVADIQEYRTDHAIVQAVLVMAQRLGIRVVAEGVETKTQLSALMELGCQYLQGYFFSAPLPLPELIEFDVDDLQVHGVNIGS